MQDEIKLIEFNNRAKKKITSCLKDSHYNYVDSIHR